MKIVVGLGNPGQEYSATRHNIGFITVDTLADRWGADTWRRKFDALVTEHRLGGEQILLLKPQTYMNLSGQAVGAALKWYKLTPGDVIVVYDDLDLPPGRIRVRGKGGAGGHRGIESLFDHLKDDGFARVKVGIGRPPQQMATADYVLGRFTPEEIQLIKPAVTRAADAVEAIVQAGVTKASNDFNGEG